MQTCVYGKDSVPKPTILRIGPYRFNFYAGDRDDPRHVPVERCHKIAKCWLDPIRPQVKRRIHDIIAAHHTDPVEAWYDYFGN